MDSAGVRGSVDTSTVTASGEMSSSVYRSSEEESEGQFSSDMCSGATAGAGHDAYCLKRDGLMVKADADTARMASMTAGFMKGTIARTLCVISGSIRWKL